MSDLPPPDDFLFADELPPPDFDELLPDDWFDYEPEDGPLPDFFDADLDALFSDDDILDDFEDIFAGLPVPKPDDESWSWSDARLISLDRGQDAGARRYEIGCMDVYANPETGDIGASYLPVAALPSQAEAQDIYHDLQEQIHDGAIAPHELKGFAQEQAFAYNPEPENWRGAEPAEYAAYEGLRNLDIMADGFDVPPDEALDPLLETAAELGGVVREIEEPGITAEQQALADIGVQAEGFDPAHNPPPFYDEQTGTAYWIGVFQPDKEDRENCVTSILSLGRDPESGEMAAHLAPCVPGDWDKTYNAAEYLIDVAQKGGIERCFDAAEGMALATEQREQWQSPHGVPLEADSANDIAETTREHWEVNL